MDTIYIIITVLAVCALSLFGVPYLVKRKIITPDNVETTNDILLVLKLILLRNAKDMEQRTATSNIIDTIRNVLHFVSVDATLSTKEEKIEEAKKLILNSLSTYSFQVDEEIEALIDSLTGICFRYVK